MDPPRCEDDNGDLALEGVHVVAQARKGQGEPFEEHVTLGAA